MNDELIKRAVNEFVKSHAQSYEKTFSVSGNSEEVFTVRFERRKKTVISESVALESRFNTISALPSGTPCSCCHGSGKSS